MLDDVLDYIFPPKRWGTATFHVDNTEVVCDAFLHNGHLLIMNDSDIELPDGAVAVLHRTMDEIEN